jgi:integrase
VFNIETLDLVSKQYLSENEKFDEKRRIEKYRNDLLTFRVSLKGKAPKTMMKRLSHVKTYLEYNGVEFPKRLLRNLTGGKKKIRPISKEKNPTNNELKRIIEYLLIHGKALAIVLATSWMRQVDALNLKIDEIEFDHTP